MSKKFLDSDGLRTLWEHIKEIDNSIATNSKIGHIKSSVYHSVASTGITPSTDAISIAVNNRTNTAGRFYSVETDSNGFAFVNVPWTDTNTNYYPTKFSWTNGTSSGPTGSLTVSGTNAVSFPAIPSAAINRSGIVTTGAQTFDGVKTFNTNSIINGTLTVKGITTSNDILSQTGSGATLGTNSHPWTAAYITTIHGSVDGNASTSDKLKTARTISLGTAVTSTATQFDGSKNITIPVNDIKEGHVTWGGRNLKSANTPIDASLIPELGANRFDYLNPDGITIEYSRDGGSSWVNYTDSDEKKQNLFSPVGADFKVGNPEPDDVATDKYQLRVTIDTTLGKTATVIRKFAIYVSRNGSSGCTVTIEKALASSPTVFTPVVTDVPIDGWSGWNIINDFVDFGTNGTVATQFRKIRFTFKITSHSSSYPGNSLSIKRIKAFGGDGWVTPSELAKTGHIYKCLSNQAVEFPGDVKFAKSATSSKFITSGGTSNQLVAGDGSLVSKSSITSSYLPLTGGTLTGTLAGTTISANILKASNNSQLTLSADGTAAKGFTVDNASSFRPTSSNTTSSLGSNTYKWRNAYINTIRGDTIYGGTIYESGQTLSAKYALKSEIPADVESITNSEIDEIFV